MEGAHRGTAMAARLLRGIVSGKTTAQPAAASRRLSRRAASADEALDNLEKIAQHDGLCDVGITPARQRPALVADHRESGDRDDRDGPRLCMVLQLPDRVETGDV